ncbi:unnamed protein product [Porites lobata]|uniref:Uncharacterized protein n=1 Tax=Porites lobata TaxID=104759 RepID=A0ABN8R468_9CNID|nr:unnamed protein product [Porites lobata]
MTVMRLDMVEIRGKRGRKVPVILTPEMINAIDVLIKTRKAVGIADENPYVFARPNRQSLEPMRAWDCLKKLSTQCEPPLSNPTNITSTRMRKNIGTISQVLSLKETEVDWLARHLGHDIPVHRDFYRLHESTIEIAKVSKLLLTVDQGKTGKFAGKTLTEIDLNEIAEPRLSDTDDELNDTDGEEDDKTDVFDEGTSSGRSTKKQVAKSMSQKDFTKEVASKSSRKSNKAKGRRAKKIVTSDIAYLEFSDTDGELDDCDEDNRVVEEHKTIRGDRSQKHKDQDKENSNCAISKTKIVKEPTKTAKIGGKDPAKKNAKKAVLKSGSRLPILRGQKRKKKLFSSISLPGLDEDVFLANVTVRIVLPKQMRLRS